MRMRKATRSHKTRFVLWTIAIASLAAVAASDLPASIKTKLGQESRKSTDPPTMGRGKMGQDLFLAIDHRDAKSVSALIAKGADPNSVNGLGFTPLGIAAASFQPDVMQLLLKAGAKPDASSTYGTPLNFAALSGDVPGAQILLSMNANPNATRTDGSTVLMMASNSGAVPLVADLIKRGVDVNAQDEGGATALSLAARNGFVDVGRALLGAGANVDSTDNDHLTPLMTAAMNGHADFVRMLLEKGAKVNATDSKGETALILTSAYGDYPDVIRTLKAGGADMKAKDSQGRTAAALAGTRGYIHSAALLGRATPGAVFAVGMIRDPREAVASSLKLLQSSMREFSKNAACISCHQEGLGRITTGTARNLGFKLEDDVQKTQMERINGALTAMRPLHEQALKNPEVMKQVPLIEINEVNTIDGWILAGMAANHEAPNAGTAAMALVLARQQSPDGFWSFSVPRVPMQSSFFTFTALAIHDLSVYGPKSHAAQTAAQIRKAKGWLLHAPAKTSEDCATRLLGLKWAGATKSEMRKPIAGVLAFQRPDGGWSQLPNLHSDAYATGQALYALREAGGMSVSDPVYKKGVKFLMETQDQDGSWFVNKRAMPANNYFDAGFPHGESQYASFNGTCWATLALMETLKR